MTQPNDTAAISFAGVSKWFRPKGQLVHALSQVSLDVSKSEFVSLIGPSGCGKSTMLRLTSGLLEPDWGTLMVEGGSPSEARARKHFGFIPQHPALLPWRTVRANVSLLCDINHQPEAEVMSADDQLDMLESIGLGPFVDALPSELSGGMMQRVSIARVFALRAPLLLADEPFSALDELTRVEMRYLLLSLWERSGSTVLFVTHSIPEAVVLSDRAVVLAARPGRITKVIDVPLPRPRDESIEDTEEYREILREVRSALKEGWSH
ncbi:MAG TPA: ABC transporter ATP-binding protein [Anaerolineales bacterium]|jgi:NitT/TauT family transport system ATP-binding protein|nr:ABC transporter ATP-binding protein [Dehalococcoidia bacterium]HJN41132.1 ABC transporter ATP-binding protein [Anaerolineales bacterium]|tara:strand:- start:5976 stop:6770 length:795 start_codon:yes stop_codon:yes gene_type:complete